MKINIPELTFLIAIRIDSIERLENLILSVGFLQKYFSTNIYILEAASFNSGIVQKYFNRSVKYEFIEDCDPIFHRTKYFNHMIASCPTEYIALWDADIIVNKSAILEGLDLLRNKQYDVVYPYDTNFYEVPTILRNIFARNKNILFLEKSLSKMKKLYDCPMVGGGVMINKEKFIEAGMENENYYGWGNDDWDRYYRFIQLNYSISHTNNVLFHLTHPRACNSKFRSIYQENISRDELLLTKSRSSEETKNIIKIKKS